MSPVIAFGLTVVVVSVVIFVGFGFYTVVTEVQKIRWALDDLVEIMEKLEKKA